MENIYPIYPRAQSNVPEPLREDIAESPIEIVPASGSEQSPIYKNYPNIGTITEEYGAPPLVVPVDTSVKDNRPNEASGSTQVGIGSSRVKWGKRIGALLLIGGAGVAFASNPIEDVKDKVLENGPAPAAALLVSEAAFMYGAGRMLVSAGKDKNIREAVNVFKTERKFGELIRSIGGASDSVLTSPGLKRGLAINTAGALGTASAIAGGAIVALPPEMWPGAFAIAGVDAAATVAVRTPIAAAIKNAEARVRTGESDVRPEKDKVKMNVRRATHEDLDTIVDIDLKLFEKAYGENMPTKDEVYEMMRRRLENGAFMHVVERNGQVEGFLSAFRTNKPAEEFTSWEETTANGTLDGKVCPDGKYLYIVNQTILHEAVVEGGRNMLYASIYADAVANNIEYGYFESRMPHFRRWLEASDQMTDDPTKLTDLAREYANMKLPSGKLKDPLLRMYASDGFRLGDAVANAFSDDASMNYGVVCIADSPLPTAIRGSKVVSKMVSGLIAVAAKHPTVLKKVL